MNAIFTICLTFFAAIRIFSGDDTGFCGPELVCNNYRCVHCVNNSTVNHKGTNKFLLLFCFHRLYQLVRSLTLIDTGLYCSENFWIDSDGQQTAAEHHIVWQILGFLVDVLEAFA